MLVIIMKKQMFVWKKLVALSLVSVLALGVAGCSKEEKQKPEKSIDQDPPTQQENKPVTEPKEEQPKKEEKQEPTLEEKDPVKEENPQEVIVKEDGNIKLSNLKASIEDDMLRLDLTCISDEDGKAYLSDGAMTNVGPLDIKKGNYTMYFLLSANKKATYTLRIETSSDKKAEFSITQEMIQEAMVETPTETLDTDE